LELNACCKEWADIGSWKEEEAKGKRKKERTITDDG
jgi:hypothetical protein